MFEEITTLDEWQPGLPILFDNRRLEMFAVDTQIIRQSVVIMQKFSRRHPATKIAGLVATNLNFGLGRQFETFTEIEGGTGFRLFRDEAQAVEWLQQPGDDDPA
ncbi:MAG: hypothetical protein JSS81_03310 [Acidobacteria bacterium]|nr:hypothetical protein [Acidobacteriota bacterium]